MKASTVDQSEPASIVIHIPHASTLVPGNVRGQFQLDSATFEDELLRMTDRYTDELFELSRPTVTSIHFPVSRLVVDPERFSDDDVEPMAAKGMGAVYQQTSRGTPLRVDLPQEMRERLLAEYYRPHHQRLERLVSASLQARGFCLIIDAHSFASSPLPHEFDQDPKRPQICIGTDGYHTPEWLRRSAIACYERQGFEVELNRPFNGALVPETHYRSDERVMSVMIELNRKLYMCEQTGQKLPRFEEVRAQNLAALAEIIDRAIEEFTPAPFSRPA